MSSGERGEPGRTLRGADKVFLTGASGFVGSAVLDVLLDEGFAVRALVRPHSYRSHLKRADIELVEGDLSDRASIKKGMSGCRYAFHVAADYRLWAPRAADIFEINVSGTRRLMEEALRARVERLVYTSSVATLALPGSGHLGDETKSASEETSVGAYKRSKIAAERIVREMVAKEGLPAVIVNPSTPIGPGDRRPTPTGRIIVAAARGQMPVFVETGLNFVDVRDVAVGHLLALRRGRIGERYILGGENVLFSRLLRDIAILLHTRPPLLRIPWYAALPFAYGAEAVAARTGKEPLATVSGAYMARHRMFFSSAKAQAELGYVARPYLAALREALHWFYKNKFIPSDAHPA